MTGKNALQQQPQQQLQQQRQKQKQHLFLNGSIGKALYSLALPIIAANILQSCYQFTDAFWVGRLGSSAVAAVSVSTPVTFLLIAIGSGLAMAGTTLTSQYMGAGQGDKINQVAGQTLLMVLALSIVLAALGCLLAPHILTLMGVDADVYKDAIKFMRVSFIGVVFVFSFSMFQSLMRGVGHTTVPLLIVLFTVVLNLILDPLFIFGYGPIPAYGVEGAALATIATQSLAAVAGIVVMLQGKYGIRLRLKHLVPQPQYMKKAVLLGLPGSLELSTRSLGLMLMSFLVASMGTMTIAAYGIGANIIQLVMIPAMGLSMAVSTLAGQNIGAGKLRRAEQITQLATLYGFLMLTAVGIIAYIFAEKILWFFVPNESEVIEQGAHFIRVMALSWGGIGIQLCILAAFRASGNMVNAMVLAMVSLWLLRFPLAYVLSKHTNLGEEGLWWSFPVSNIITAIIALAWFAQGSWKHTVLIDEQQQQSMKTTDEILCEEGYRH
ncbi:MATE family efflux transporter [Agaribacterium haliotis]|uniref:MATE family efflux transporter n=1 Tax=Agaribacterium haliotis TaxID=2013869 RepID=UPI000BB579F0|nr:MATE family efflux transporter [Agaribacterium haliotis]